MPVKSASRTRRAIPISKLLFATLLIGIFIASLKLTSLYSSGDQYYYRLFYFLLRGLSRDAISELQAEITGSSEPSYGFVMWLGASLGVEKAIYISAFNVAFAGIILRRINAAGVTWHSVCFSLLLLSNFYALVLFTSAERLKFAYLTASLSLLSTSRVFQSLAAIAAITFHFQFAIVLMALICGKLSSIRPRRFIKRSQLSRLATGALAFGAALIFLLLYREQVLFKFAAYAEPPDLNNILQISLLTLVAVICLPKKAEAIGALMTLMMFALFLGGDRVNMIAVTLVIWYVIRDGIYKSAAVTFLMLYFSLKGLSYIERILQTGQGF